VLRRLPSIPEEKKESEALMMQGIFPWRWICGFERLTRVKRLE
jgi:hypothetical protein